MANDSVTGFFSLPRELRDEIYKYILVFKPLGSKYTPIGDRETYCTYKSLDISGPPIEFQLPRLNLSLLRVCRRVHAEALPVFYGDNVFSIFVSFKLAFVNSNNFMSTTHSYWRDSDGLLVTHYAPWEQLGYIYPVANMPDECRRYRPLGGYQQIGTPFQPTETVNSMATVLPNGHLIRRLRIHCDVSNLSSWRELGRPVYGGSGNHVLSHLAARIQASTPNAFKEITAFHGEDLKWGLTHTASMTYQTMVNLVWPLTATGGYRITIMIYRDFIEASYPGEVDELLAKCRSDAQDGKEEDFVNIPVEEGSHWAIAKGRLIVQADEALFSSSD